MPVLADSPGTCQSFSCFFGFSAKDFKQKITPNVFASGRRKQRLCSAEDSKNLRYLRLLLLEKKPTCNSCNLFNLRKAHLCLKLSPCHLIISDFRLRLCAELRRWGLSSQRRSSSALFRLF